MPIPNPKDEPVAYAGIVTFLAGLVVAFAAKYSIVLDPSVVAGAFGSLALILIPVVRRVVHPASKVQAHIDAAIADATTPVTHITIPPKDAA